MSYRRFNIGEVTHFLCNYTECPYNELIKEHGKKYINYVFRSAAKKYKDVIQTFYPKELVQLFYNKRGKAQKINVDESFFNAVASFVNTYYEKNEEYNRENGITLIEAGNTDNEDLIKAVTINFYDSQIEEYTKTGDQLRMRIQMAYGSVVLYFDGISEFITSKNFRAATCGYIVLTEFVHTPQGDEFNMEMHNGDMRIRFRSFRLECEVIPLSEFFRTHVYVSAKEILAACEKYNYPAPSTQQDKNAEVFRSDDCLLKNLSEYASTKFGFQLPLTELEKNAYGLCAFFEDLENAAFYPTGEHDGFASYFYGRLYVNYEAVNALMEKYAPAPLAELFHSAYLIYQANPSSSDVPPPKSVQEQFNALDCKSALYDLVEVVDLFSRYISDQAASIK